MGQEHSIKNIVWQLPMVSAENNNTGYIHGNAKPHAFAPSDDNLINWSLCKKYGQYSKEYETINIEGVEEKHLCKKCLERYKKLKKKEEDNK